MYRETFVFGVQKKKIWNLASSGIEFQDCKSKLIEMDFADASPRPAKKRRFFEESSPEDSSPLPHGFEDTDERSSVLTIDSITDRESRDIGGPAAPIHKDINILPVRSNGTENTDVGFDNDAFEAIVGEPVAPSVLRKLKEVSAGDTRRGTSSRGRDERSLLS